MKKITITNEEYKILRERDPLNHIGTVLEYFYKSFPERREVSHHYVLEHLAQWIAFQTMGRSDLGYGCFLILEFLDNKHNYN